MRTARRLLSQARSPDSGLQGQGIRFAIAGGAVAVLYIAVTTTLADVFGAPFQVALIVGFGMAVIAHFTLQRLFVWVHHADFALPLHRQAARYLVAAGAQYGVTAAATAFLPGALGAPVTAVYLVAVAVCSTLNFLVFRLGVVPSGRGARSTAQPPQKGDRLGEARGRADLVEPLGGLVPAELPRVRQEALERRAARSRPGRRARVRGRRARRARSRSTASRGSVAPLSYATHAAVVVDARSTCPSAPRSGTRSSAPRQPLRSQRLDRGR